MTDNRDTLAALIRENIEQADHWWAYCGDSDGELPEALATDLLAARWQPPQILTPDEAAVAALLMEAGSKLIRAWSDEPKLQQIKDDIARW